MTVAVTERASRKQPPRHDACIGTANAVARTAHAASLLRGAGQRRATRKKSAAFAGMGRHSSNARWARCLQGRPAHPRPRVP